MPIPAFDKGILPAFNESDPTSRDRSPYLATIVDVVHRFGSTPHRQNLLRGLVDYRQMLAAGGYVSGFQFVDGSFVEDAEFNRGRPPEDIDVVSFLDPPLQYANNQSAWASTGMPFWVNEVIDIRKNKARFSVHPYAWLVQRPDLAFVERTCYWHGVFSFQRDTHEPKGFLIVPINAQHDNQALSILSAI